MSDKDDPFGLSNDAGRTRIRPMRSGQPQAPATAGAPPPPPRGGPPGYVGGGQGGGYGGGSQGGGYEPAPRLRQSRAHPNVFVAAFAPLLELAPELEHAAAPQRPDSLRIRSG